MAQQAFTFFDTSIGRCGMVWSADGVCAVMLPEATELETWRRLLRRFPDAAETRPTGMALDARDHVQAHLRGETSQIDDIPLDTSDIAPFNQRVYAITRAIPRGETLTYGEVATQLGASGAARAVGKALGQNPIPIIIPCHRVLAANGATGGFSANGGITTKFRLLSIEGAKATSTPTLFDVIFSIPPSRQQG